MRKTTKCLLWFGVCLGILAAIPTGIWFSLTYQPSYYRDMVLLTREQRGGPGQEVRRPEPSAPQRHLQRTHWEAVFSDQEVNAWLAEDLVTHFLDQLPPEINEPRLLFELDRVTLAFQLRQRGVESVITVVARPRVPEGNTVELTLEKIRAGSCLYQPTMFSTASSIMRGSTGLMSSGLARMAILSSSCAIRRTSSARTCDSRNSRSVPARSGSRDGPIEPRGLSKDPSSPRARCFNPSFRSESSRMPHRPIPYRPGAVRLHPPVENPPARPGHGQPTRPRLDRSLRPSAGPSPGSRRSPLVLQIEPPVVSDRSSREIHSRNDRRIDRPGPQDLARLEHEVPVHSVPDMLQQHKPRHPYPDPPQSVEKKTKMVDTTHSRNSKTCDSRSRTRSSTR